MSYLVLARKYRPQTFAEVVGQKGVVRILKNAVATGRVPHAMLFSGVRGVGKTTLARIMAKAINCEAEPVQAPCNQCASCSEITRGSAVDIKEIDGASNRGIQEIRDLQEDLRFMPSRARYKVVIIDEVHMLTEQAFNALLKTLEEPPPHVVFMFATTEVHKIPVTILSRCQRFELRRVGMEELVDAFAAIAQKEGVEISRSGLEMVAREARGSVRDGLSLLDQLFSLAGESVSDDDIREVLGLVNQAALADLARALIASDLAACLAIVDRCMSGGVDVRRLHSDLLDYFRSLVVCRTVSEPGALLAVSDGELAVMREMVSGAELETIASVFDILLKGAEELKFAPRPRLVFEMIMLRATQAANVAGVDEILARLDAIASEGRLSVPVSAEDARPGPRRPPAPPPSPARASGPEKPEGRKQAPARRDGVSGRVEADPGSGKQEPVSAAGSGEPEKSPEEKPASPRKDEMVRPLVRNVRRAWNDFVTYVADRRIAISAALKLATPLQDGDELELRYEERSDCAILEEKENLHLLTEFVQDFFQQDLTLRIRVVGEGEAAADDETRQERQALRNDPLVAMTVEVLDGRVTDVRTGPRSR